LRLEPWKNPTVQKMRRPETITAVFLPTAQYTLTIVSMCECGITAGDPQGAGVYDPGMSPSWSVTSPWPVSDTEQCVALDPTSGVVENMYADTTVTINWKTQYYLTIVSERGGDPVGAGWYDKDATASWSVTSPVAGTEGTKYEARPASGDEIMTEAKTVTVNWVTMYRLLTAANPPELGTVDPAGENWYDAGFEVPLAVTPNAGYTFVWSGDLSGTETSITMDGPKSITANFYQPTLTISNPLGFGSPSPAVGTYTYNAGDSPTCTINPTEYRPLVPQTTYATFTEGFETGMSGWTVTGNWSQSGSPHSGTYCARDYNTTSGSDHNISRTFTIGPGGGTVTFWWHTQCSYSSNSSRSYLRFLIDGGEQVRIYGTNSWQQSATFNLTAGSHTVEWRLRRYSSSSSTYHIYGWLDDISVTNVPTTVMVPDPNSRCIYKGYTGTGSCPSGTDSSVTFPIYLNSTLTWNWEWNYKLFVSASPASRGTVDYPVQEWYVGDSSVTLTAVPSLWYYTLANWSGDLTGSENPATISMTKTKTIVANFGVLQGNLTVASEYDSPNPAVGPHTYDYGTSLTCSVSLWAFPTASGTATEGFESGSLPAGWSTGAMQTAGGVIVPLDAPWFVTSGDKHSGTYSARSGPIPNAPWIIPLAPNITYIQKQFSIGGGGGAGVSFWWKVSSETNYDWLEFYIDGVRVGRITGTGGDWAQVSFPLSPGIHTMKWQYTKDFSSIGGSDCAWIDDVVVTNTAPPDTNYVCTGWTGTGSVVPPSGTETSVTFTILDPESTITWNWKLVYQLNVSVNPAGTGTVAVEYGEDTVTLTATATATGYMFANWSGDLSGTENPTTFTQTGPMNVTANFAVPDEPYNFAGTATSASAITWSWLIFDADSSITSFEVRDSANSVLGTVGASPWPETGLSENTQYTRHVHAVGGGESGDASRYTLVHDATTLDFSLLQVGGAVTTQTKTPATGSNAMKVPIDISANYARCQMLFYGSEIGMGGTPGAIYKLRFQRYSGDADTVNNVEIYMTHTTLGTPGMPGTGLTSWQDTSTHTLVYSGNLNIPTGAQYDLYEITLGPAFNYNGSSNLIVTVRHQDGSGELTSTTWMGANFSLGTYYCLAGASNTDNPPAVAAVVSRPNTQFDVSTGGGVLVTVTPPPNSTAASTGVRIERDTDPGFSMPVLVQNYAQTYSKGDRPPGAGTYYYRIIFRNGDAVPSAYSAGNSVVVP
jgi:hypothetical protein